MSDYTAALRKGFHLPRAFRSMIDAFLSCVQRDCCRSKVTILTYERSLLEAANFMHRRGHPSWLTITIADATAWLKAAARHAARTQMRKLAALRGLGRFMVRMELRSDDFTRLLKSPKPLNLTPNVLTAAEVQSVVEAFGDEDLYSIRNRAILEILYGCGLRANEISTLPVAALDFPGKQVYVLGKCRKERLVPMNLATEVAIKRYLEVRPRFVKQGQSQPLFLSDEGNGISRTQVWRMVVEAGRRAGIEADEKSKATKRHPNNRGKRYHKIHPHALRHSFGSHLIARGAGVHAVQKMLGSENPPIPLVFTGMDRAKIFAEHEARHPRNLVNLSVMDASGD